jgi:hypothetical protein
VTFGRTRDLLVGDLLPRLNDDAVGDGKDVRHAVTISDRDAPVAQMADQVQDFRDWRTGMAAIGSSIRFSLQRAWFARWQPLGVTPDIC